MNCLRSMIALNAAVCLWFAVDSAYGSDNGATRYMLAVIDNTRSVPGYVDLATTDDPVLGFSKNLTEQQLSFLQMPNTVAALARFDEASLINSCEWDRFSDFSWSTDNLIDSLHQLSRTVLLRARFRYQSGKWIEANSDVVNVLKLARRMVTLCRFYEHQLFTIENMANGTAAAWLFRLPNEALVDLSMRLSEVGVFSPMRQVLADESSRLKHIGEFHRENAQGVCRGIFFRAVVKQMISGNHEFSTISDPFGNGHASHHVTGGQHVLVSVLTNHRRIDFQFGLAGINE